MSKFVVLLVATLAYFHATSANPTKAHPNPWVNGIVNQIQNNTNDATKAVQDAQTDGKKHTRALESQINEWVFKIQSANYHLERAVQYYEGTNDLQTLDQIIGRLSEVAHSMKNALIGSHERMKTKLETSLEDVASEAKKLSDITQQHLKKEQQNQPHIAEELEEVLEELLGATRQLKIRRQIQMLNLGDIKNKIRSVVKQLTDTVQGINPSDLVAAQELAHQTHELSHDVERFSHILRRDALHRLQGESKTTVQEISYKLNEIESELDEVAGSQGENNAEAWIADMKTSLKTCVGSIGTQMENLAQLLKFEDESHFDIHANNLIRSILAEALSEALRLEWQLENIETQKH